jgi:hypothetical protein
MAVANVTMVLGNHVPLSAMARTTALFGNASPSPTPPARQAITRTACGTRSSLVTRRPFYATLYSATGFGDATRRDASWNSSSDDVVAERLVFIGERLPAPISLRRRCGRGAAS